MEPNRETHMTELVHSLEVAASAMREVDDHVARQDWKRAEAALQKATDEYRKCFVDLRILGTRTGMPT